MGPLDRFACVPAIVLAHPGAECDAVNGGDAVTHCLGRLPLGFEAINLGHGEEHGLAPYWRETAAPHKIPDVVRRASELGGKIVRRELNMVVRLCRFAGHGVGFTGVGTSVPLDLKLDSADPGRDLTVDPISAICANVLP
jgi:hypothetical protein